jgi:hypothetical protein
VGEEFVELSLSDKKQALSVCGIAILTTPFAVSKF